MSWIKISEDDGGTYGEEAAPDPQRVQTLNKLQSEIDDIQDQIDAIGDEVPYPDQATDDQREAIDRLNEDRGIEKIGLTQQKDELQSLYDELEALG